MTTLALNTATRSFAFLGTFMDALNKAVMMAKAVRQNRPSAANIKNVRAIAATI
jgi:hypothetical protein